MFCFKKTLAGIIKNGYIHDENEYMNTQDGLVGLLVFNDIFSTNRLYRVMDI